MKYSKLCTKKSLKIVYIEEVGSVFPLLCIQVDMKFWI